MVVRKKIFFSARFQKKNRRSISLSLAFDRLLLVCWEVRRAMHSRQLGIVAFLSIALLSTSASEYTPCPNSCSANGLCSRPWGVCQCFDGFTGADCSLRTCPFGAIAWADSATADDLAHHPAECSNRGKCDRVLGECQCGAGFEGSACERFVCPNNCSEKGRCISAKSLASMQDPGIQRKTDGCTSSDICQDVDCNDRDYGKCKENYVYETPWDADHWFGCLCDEGYTGKAWTYSYY